MNFIAKLLNKIATLLPKDYSRVLAGFAKMIRPTEFFLDTDDFVTLVFYRFPFFRNRFLRVENKLFNKNVESNSKYFNFDFSKDVLNSVREKGLSGGFTIKQEWLDEIYKELNNVPLDWDGKIIQKEFKEIESIKKEEFGIAQAHYKNVIQNPLFMKISTDPALLNFASGYLNSAELNVDVFCWWNFPITKENLKSNYFGDYNFGQEFQFDHTSRRMFKVFVYLTDCDDDGGPHVFIEKTHLRRPFMISLKQLNLNESDLKKYIKKTDDWKTIKGPKGACFICDHFGMHMGENPKEKQRLVLQFMYSVNPLGKQNFSTHLNVPNYIKSLPVYQDVQPPSTARSAPVM